MQKFNLKSLLKETRKIIDINTHRNYINEDACRQVCLSYTAMREVDRYRYLKELSTMHDYSMEKVQNLLFNKSLSEVTQVRKMYHVKESLQPKYRDFFMNLGKHPEGIKLLVDLRSDIIGIQNILKQRRDKNMTYATETSDSGELVGGKVEKGTETVEMFTEELNETEVINNLFILSAELKDMIGIWFSGGFCKLTRVTWDSSCHILQRISELEAVHPIRNWLDIKQRVGNYRRCHVFTHVCIPNEPIIILHTALCPLVPNGIREIVSRTFKRQNIDSDTEDPAKIKAAVFYSISLPHQGLSGINLGNTLIKRVVQQLRYEFPGVEYFCTLSPLPNFSSWINKEIRKILMDEVNHRITTQSFNENSNSSSSSSSGSGSSSSTLTQLIGANLVDELSQQTGSSTAKDLVTQLSMNLERISFNFAGTNFDNCENHSEYQLMRRILVRMAAKYLLTEKHRGFVYDSVCNFHLRNGAVISRINWLADPTPKGMRQSYGVMVNYRYYIERCEENSQSYIDKKVIKMSPEVAALLEES